jgi:hypothetical protein
VSGHEEPAASCSDLPDSSFLRDVPHDGDTGVCPGAQIGASI